MIRVSITSMVLVIVCTSAGIVLLLWLLNEWRRFRQNIRLQKETRQCPLCFFEFLKPNKPALVICPRCGASTD